VAPVVVARGRAGPVVKLPGTHQDKRRRGSCAGGRSHSHARKVGPRRRVKVKGSVLRRRVEAKGMARRAWDAEVEHV
jgi:hypothetical protein